MKYNSLKSLINQVLEKYKSKNVEIDKTAPFRYSELKIYVPILLIEEPELLLHPFLATGVTDSVKELADNNITTIMTTHSPFFLSHLIHSNKSNLIIKKKDEDKKLLLPLYFWKLINEDKIKDKVIEEYKEFARPNEEEEIENSRFYKSKWKRLLNEYTLKIFFSKNVLFVEGMTEYILFNSILTEVLGKELSDIEIIPIFNKFHYVFFDELAKRMGLKYWFLLDKDRKVDEKGKEKWSNRQRKFWEKYGEKETSEETNGIIHSKESSERRISWSPSYTEGFLEIELEHDDVRQCCKEYNLISNAKTVLDNLEEKPEKLKELKKLLSFVKAKKEKKS